MWGGGRELIQPGWDFKWYEWVFVFGHLALTLWHFSKLRSHANVTSTNFSVLSSSWNMSVRLLKWKMWQFEYSWLVYKWMLTANLRLIVVPPQRIILMGIWRWLMHCLLLLLNVVLAACRVVLWCGRWWFWLLLATARCHAWLWRWTHSRLLTCRRIQDMFLAAAADWSFTCRRRHGSNKFS